MSRGRYEFSEHTKQAAIRQWRSENPENEDTPLEVDHIVQVSYAKKAGIPPDLVRTRDNARAMPVPEHKERHRNEQSDEEYKTLAQSILGWIGNLL